MRGSIMSACRGVCPCGGVFRSEFNNLIKFNIPLCEKCKNPPQRLRVRKVIPGTNGKSVTKDFYRDTKGEVLTTIADCLGLIGHLNDELKAKKFRPEQHDPKFKDNFKFNKFCELYLKHHTERTKLPPDDENFLTPAGYKEKSRLVIKVLMPYWESINVGDISPIAIEEFYYKVKGDRQRVTATQELKTILRFAHRKGVITTVPVFPELRRARIKRAEEIPDKDVQVQVINAIDDHKYWVMWVLTAIRPCRPCETMGQLVGDVDPFTSKIKIQGHISKGINGPEWIPGRKAIKASDPMGTISHQIEREFIQNHLSRYMAGKGPKDALFSGNRNKFVSEDAMSSAWRKACVKIGVKVRPYDGTKHATLKDMKFRGESDAKLQQRSGITNLITLARYTTDLSDKANNKTDATAFSFQS